MCVIYGLMLHVYGTGSKLKTLFYGAILLKYHVPDSPSHITLTVDVPTLTHLESTC